MAAKTIRELTADAAPAQTRLMVTQSPSSGEPTKSTGAQFLAAAGLNPAATSGVILERPAASSQNAYPWRMIVSQNNFNDGSGIGGENYYNEVTALGWNLGTTVGVPATESTPAFWDSWESKYNANLADYAFERHIEMVDSNGDLHRILSFLVPHDGSTGSGALFAVERINFFPFDTDGSQTTMQFDLLNRSANFGDTANAFVFQFPKNNSAFLVQRNAADDAFLALPYFNGSDQLVVGGQILSAATAPGAGESAHAFTITGTSGDGCSLFAIAIGGAQTGTINALNIGAATNYELISLIQNNNSASSISAAIQSLQTAASNGKAYMRFGYTAGQQWSFGRKSDGNLALHADGAFGSEAIFAADKTNLNVSFDKPPKVPSHAAASPPSASTYAAGSLIFVTDETGGATLAYSDGTNWRRVADREVIS